MGVNREICYCLGEGKNFKFFQKFNDEHQFFSRVISLPHPRFIMQYKLKMKEEFISTYLQLLQTEK